MIISFKYKGNRSRYNVADAEKAVAKGIEVSKWAAGVVEVIGAHRVVRIENGNILSDRVKI